jgi:hypothetical protein
VGKAAASTPSCEISTAAGGRPPVSRFIFAASKIELIRFLFPRPAGAKALIFLSLFRHD